MGLQQSFKRILESITFPRVFGLIFLALLALLVFAVWDQNIEVINLEKFGYWLIDPQTVNLARGVIKFAIIWSAIVITVTSITVLIVVYPGLINHLIKSLTFARIVALLLLVFAALILIMVSSSGLELINLEKFGKWLGDAGTADVARGLITVLVVLATVIIALALVAYVIFEKKDGDETCYEKRFNRGLQVLTLFMGILGTIMGFYYAEGTLPVKDAKELAAGDSKKAITLAELENKGWRALKDLNFEVALEAFSDARKDNEHSPVVDRVLELLEPVKDKFAELKGEKEKMDLWKPILCKIKGDNSLSDIPAEIKKGLDGTIAGFACPTPTPNPTGTIAPPVEGSVPGE